MRRRRPIIVALATVCLAAAAWPWAARARDDRFLLVVSGLGGEPYYGELFQRWSASLLDVARRRYRMDDRNIVYLAESRDGGANGLNGISRKADVLAAVSELARRSVAGDRVVIVLIGHGSAGGPDPRFNLPGPDITPAELGRALSALRGRQVAIVDTSPASGAFVGALSAPGRVVIAATASGAEAQHTRFAGFFIDALATDGADTDKDRTVSLLEAFRYARRQVERAYRDDNRLVTEHALLDDNGDGEGTHDPPVDGGDGELAARFDLAPSGGVTATATSDPRLKLQIEARELVDRIERLKRDKRRLGRMVYERRLEDLLVELALNRRAYRAQGDR